MIGEGGKKKEGRKGRKEERMGGWRKWELERVGGWTTDNNY